MYETAGGTIRFLYHAIPPALVFIDLDHGPSGHRMVTQVVLPHSPTSCTIFLGAGVGPDYTGGTVEDAVATEGAVLAEDVPILDSMIPPEAPLDGTGQAHVAADRYTLEYRKAFVEFVHRAVSEPASERAAPTV